MKRNVTENGQSLVIVAIAFFALVAVAALIIDGGILYLNRRNAQTAADAAAIAGAHELCVNNGNTVDVQNTVNQYAITENGATAVDNITIIDTVIDEEIIKSVAVQTRVETSSFFARILGYENNSVRADATAQCFPPKSTKNLLPISWACQPPENDPSDPNPPPPGTQCTIESIPQQLFKNEILPRWGKNGTQELGLGGTLILDQGDGENYTTYRDGSDSPMIYIIMDSSTQSTDVCIPSGDIDCDLNNDGIPELSGGGDRGWLALDGSGTKSLEDVVTDGVDTLYIPQWFPTKQGRSQVVFSVLQGNHQYPSKVEESLLVPVYNAYCESTNDTTLPTDCIERGYQSTDQIAEGGGATYYRVASFSPFVITCVSTSKNEFCPGKTLAGLTKENKLDGISTIEGYFITGSIGSEIDPPGFYLGNYIVTLIK